MAACPTCGEPNPDHARFCLACGAPFAAEPAPRESRKTVTVLFCDVIDSTPLGERLDAETYRRVISRYFVEASRVLERHGGTVEKFIGDAVMAVFGIPTVHEDDALRACKAAAELREALAALNTELRVEVGIELGLRTGINTGEVLAGDPAEGQAFATGDAVVVAQRLEAVAGPGEILIGEPTQRLVRDAALVEPVEPLALKGKDQPVSAWRLLGIVTGAPAFARRLDSPLVGRERELALLEGAYRRAVDERSCHLFTVLGPAGVGKSRLVSELLTKLGDEALVLIGRCLPYGEGITFWPLRDVVRQTVSSTPREAPEHTLRQLTGLLAAEPEAELVVERLAAATGLSEGTAGSEETFWAVRKLLEALAETRPVIVAFDDVQWAEPTFLDLIDHLAVWTRDASVLLVCLARPELLDDRPVWGGGKLNATSILLEALRQDDVERLIAHVLGETEVAEEITSSLLEAGEGNPLFVEEMIGMLIDHGRLREEDGRWRAAGELTAVDAPPTIQALLGARLDGLEERERELLERAAVVGRIFTREALAALAPQKGGLDDQLERLVRKDLIRPDRTSGEGAYRFRHILIRDAAYFSLAKERRAELHERFAAWLEDARADRLREFEEILGYHLEQAHRYRSELAPADEHTRRLGARAAELLAEAGRRAFARGDARAAVGLLTRATLLLRDDDPARRELAPQLGTALIAVGEFGRAEGVLTRALEEALAAGDRRLELRARLELTEIRIRTEPGTGTDELLSVAQEAIEVFEQLGDDAGLTRAWVRIGDVYWMTAKWAKRAEALERALVHARRAGDRRQVRWILGSLAVSLNFGSTPAAEGIRRCEQFLEEAERDRVLESRVLVVLAELLANLGRFDEARDHYRRSKSILEELDLKLLAGFQVLVGGTVELLAGDSTAAVAELRDGYETLQAIGEKASLSTVAALLGEALYVNGEYEEAERFTEISEAAAPREDVASQVTLRGTRAKILARRGELEDAERLAREAVALAEPTDALNMQGDALANLAEVLRLGGREQEALAPLERAAGLYGLKGNVVARDRSARSLAALTPTR
jgi:predicted ATPase/class 3 adenylate cyclase